MTNEAKKLLEAIKDKDFFQNNKFVFIGGTALSYYLDHRVSYDIDLTSSEEINSSSVSSFIFSMGGKKIPDPKATTFKINTGKNLENFFMKFSLNGIKIEFVHFNDPIRNVILKNADTTPIAEGAKLHVLSMKDVIKLKVIALFNRNKTRNLFDIAYILKEGHLQLEEFERIYSFLEHEMPIREYIEKFRHDKEGDNSLDFLPHQEYYKEFNRLNQKERFFRAKQMILEIYDQKQKEHMEKISKKIMTKRRKK